MPSNNNKDIADANQNTEGNLGESPLLRDLKHDHATNKGVATDCLLVSDNSDTGDSYLALNELCSPPSTPLRSRTTSFGKVHGYDADFLAEARRASAAIWESWVNSSKPKRSAKRPLELDLVVEADYPRPQTPDEPCGPAITVDELELSSALDQLCRLPPSEATLLKLEDYFERTHIDASTKRRRLSGSQNLTNPFAASCSHVGLNPEWYCCRRPMMVEVGTCCWCNCTECTLSHTCELGPSSAKNHG